MPTDPCLEMNKIWEDTRKPLNEAFKAFPRAINTVTDGMDTIAATIYEVLNKFVEAINTITNDPLKVINSFTDSLFAATSSLKALNTGSISGIIYIILLPTFVKISNFINKALFFLPDISLSTIILIVSIVVFILMFGHIIGSIYNFVLGTINILDFILSIVLKPFLGGSASLKAGFFAWFFFIVGIMAAAWFFVRIPVPCSCGDAPASHFLTCQAGSEKGSVQCNSIANQNKIMSEAYTRATGRIQRIAAKTRELIPPLPINEMPSLQVPDKIPKVPVVDIFKPLNLPPCLAQINDILKKADAEIKKIETDIEKTSEDFGKTIENAGKNFVETSKEAAQNTATGITTTANSIADLFKPKPNPNTEKWCSGIFGIKYRC